MKLIKKIYKTITFFIFLFIIANIVCYSYALITPKISIKNINSFYIYDNKEELVFQGSGSKEWINLENISQDLIKATISVEDKNFYNHKGFDYLRIAKAMLENIKSQKVVQGASTISQQYAKNLFLSFEKSWERKWKEMWLTFELESHYEKDEILEGYLNTINYGHGMYGIENAAKYYFNKSASDLTLAEASMLAGIPNSPANYSPITNENLAKKRQKTVLKRMLENGYINNNQFKTALSEELKIHGKVDTLNLTTIMYYQDAVMNELKNIKEIPNSYLETGGLKIYTELDLRAQTILEASINKHLKNEELQTASIMMKPDDGSIIALVGGRDYSKSQYNRALSSKRQPGSAIKPFLYYSALENGFTPSTTFLSQKTVFNLSNNQTYSPQNYGDKYPDKAISLATAISYSDNIYAVKTHLFLGAEALIDMTKRVGFSTELSPIASAPLGSNEINIIELTKGYAAFANEGAKVESHFIKRVEDMNGNVLYEFRKEEETVLNKSITYVLNELLTTTYDNAMIEYNYPTCIGIANKLSRKYAMKSGTTDTDAWIIGYNPDIVIANWIGYDDNKEVTSTESLNNKKVWADTIENYLKDTPKSWYEMPNNVVGVLVDPISGTIANERSKNKKILYYIKGTEPSDTITVFDEKLSQPESQQQNH